MKLILLFFLLFTFCYSRVAFDQRTQKTKNLDKTRNISLLERINRNEDMKNLQITKSIEFRNNSNSEEERPNLFHQISDALFIVTFEPSGDIELRNSYSLDVLAIMRSPNKRRINSIVTISNNRFLLVSDSKISILNRGFKIEKTFDTHFLCSTVVDVNDNDIVCEEDDDMFSIYSLSKGEKIRSFITTIKNFTIKSAIRFSEDKNNSKIIIALFLSNHLYVIDTNTEEVVEKIEMESDISSLIKLDENHFAVGVAGDIKIYDLSLKIIHHFNHFPNTLIGTMTILGNSHFAVWNTLSFEISIYNWREKKLEKQIKTQSNNFQELILLGGNHILKNSDNEGDMKTFYVLEY